MKSKTIVIALILTFIVSLFAPATAHAANHTVHDGETFDMQAEGVASGDIITIDNNAVVTIVGDPYITYNDVIIIGQKVDLTIRDVKITNTMAGSPIILSQQINNLRLEGDNVLIHTGQFAALQVPEAAYTRIMGSGSLEAISDNASGIGANINGKAGFINISSGTITAKNLSGNDNPCIGGDGSFVYIHGGTVRAIVESNTQASGIGSTGSGLINITGGNVIAEGNLGAGIGGYGGNLMSSPITIDGGNIIAKSKSGAGIGGEAFTTSNNILITGGMVYAESEYGAGIGSGTWGIGAPIHIDGGCIDANSIYGEDIGDGDAGIISTLYIDPSATIFLAHGQHCPISGTGYNYRPLRLNDGGVPLSKDTVVTLHNPDFYVMNTTVHRDDGMLYAFLPFGDFNFTKDDGAKITENFGIGGYALDILDLTFTDRPCSSTHQITVQGTILNNEDEPYEDLDVTLCSTPRYDKTDAAGEFAFHDVNLYDHSLFINQRGMPVDKFILTFTLGDSLSWTLDGHTLSITVTADTSLVDITLKSQTEGDLDIVDVTGFSASQNPNTGDWD